jgi:hypothetical protein
VTREETGTSTQGGALFSLVPLVWESNPNFQGGWCNPTTSPSGDLIPTIRGSGAHPGRGKACSRVCVYYGEDMCTCATRDDEPRPVWTSLPITH